MHALPFQIEDAAFLRGMNHRALWSEPGTGKTLGAAVALDDVESALVVAPAAATTQWQRVLEGRGIDAQLVDPSGWPGSQRGRVLITSWGLLGRGVVDHYRAAGWSFEALVLDEAHKAVRDSAARTEAAVALTRVIPRVWPLTGTPMIRYADDLWPLCNALWPAHLAALGVSTWPAFRTRFCSMRNGFVVGSRQFTLRTLHEALYGRHLREELPQVVRRRTLEEVAPFLPPVTTRQYVVPLTKGERARVDAELTPELMTALAAAETALEADEHVATARRALGLLKAPEAAELVREAPGKVIAGYWHHEVGDVLSGRLSRVPQVRLSGGTPQAKRQGIVDAFNKPGGPKVLLLQLAAGGEAINPHENCSHMIFAERDWSGAQMNQALGRVRRFGQSRHQQIDFVDADHPIDLAMERISARKMRDLGVLV